MSNTAPIGFIEVTIPPELASVTLVRNSVSHYFGPKLNDAALVSKLGLVLHELLENAIKHSGGEPVRLRVELSAERLRVCTWNRPTAEHLEILRERLEAITAASDPNVHYLALMAESARRTVGSGLGLGRIAAEADFTLRCDLEGGELCVSAESRR